jgi:hypothetical protein
MAWRRREAIEPLRPHMKLKKYHIIMNAVKKDLDNGNRK